MRFNKEGILFVLQYLNELRRGEHIEQHLSYLERPLATRRGGGIHAPFENPALLATEITDRMEQCGIDGLILLAMGCWGEKEQSLAKYFGMPEWSVTKRYKRALAYVASGPARRWHDTKKRKGETYQEFRMRRGKNEALLSR